MSDLTRDAIDRCMQLAGENAALRQRVEALEQEITRTEHDYSQQLATVTKERDMLANEVAMWDAIAKAQVERLGKELSQWKASSELMIEANDRLRAAVVELAEMVMKYVAANFDLVTRKDYQRAKQLKEEYSHDATT